jgi:hypothetical protein
MGKLRTESPPKAAGLGPADSRKSAPSLSKGRLSPHCDLSNRELIGQFECDLIPEDSFHHADHVRLAFAYLCEYPPLQALDKFSAALKRFAVARGKSQLYHETITHAYFFLIRERMARQPAADWQEFSQRNPDLQVWKDGILSRYYQQATLQSDLARAVFLLPDKLCGV